MEFAIAIKRGITRGTLTEAQIYRALRGYDIEKIKSFKFDLIDEAFRSKMYSVAKLIIKKHKKLPFLHHVFSNLVKNCDINGMCVMDNLGYPYLHEYFFIHIVNLSYFKKENPYYVSVFDTLNININFISLNRIPYITPSKDYSACLLCLYQMKNALWLNMF